MPIKSGKLTAQEQVFVEQMARTDDKHYSASKAGYAQPVQAASALLKRPAVTNATAEKRRAALEEIHDLLPVAIGVVREALTDPRHPIQHRLKAAKMVVDAVKDGADPSEMKELHEMNASEIGRLLAAAEARLIDVTPNAEPLDPAPIEPVNLGVLD